MKHTRTANLIPIQELEVPHICDFDGKTPLLDFKYFPFSLAFYE